MSRQGALPAEGSRQLVMSADSLVVLEISEQIATITLNRPEVRPHRNGSGVLRRTGPAGVRKGRPRARGCGRGDPRGGTAGQTSDRRGQRAMGTPRCLLDPAHDFGKNTWQSWEVHHEVRTGGAGELCLLRSADGGHDPRAANLAEFDRVVADGARSGRDEHRAVFR